MTTTAEKLRAAALRRYYENHSAIRARNWLRYYDLADTNANLVETEAGWRLVLTHTTLRAPTLRELGSQYRKYLKLKGDDEL